MIIKLVAYGCDITSAAGRRRRGLLVWEYERRTDPMGVSDTSHPANSVLRPVSP
jgi:hypothetical protein